MKTDSSYWVPFHMVQSCHGLGQFPGKFAVGTKYHVCSLTAEQPKQFFLVPANLYILIVKNSNNNKKLFLKHLRGKANPPTGKAILTALSTYHLPSIYIFKHSSSAISVYHTTRHLAWTCLTHVRVIYPKSSITVLKHLTDDGGFPVHIRPLA